MEIVDEIARLSRNHRAVVVYSSAIPVARALSLDISSTAKKFVARIVSALDGQILLMPTFTSGYDSNNFLSLDHEKSSTGIISEVFRQTANVRTPSAFFSFSATGPDTEKFTNLRPHFAWGEGSLYEWMFNSDALIVTIGLHPTHCSFTHYAESLMEDKINYRKHKKFSGTIELEGHTQTLDEVLFVRHTTPQAINDFTWLSEPYRAAGQELVRKDGVLISAIPAQRKIEVILKFLQKNPNALISNREDICDSTI